MVSEICQNCAECCKNHPYVEVSPDEINGLEKMTGLPMGAFTNPKGWAGEGHFLQFRENGDCFFLNENDGGYSCSVYGARPEICRNYPSKPAHHERCNANREMALRNK
jgi:uncharacterized protein